MDFSGASLRLKAEGESAVLGTLDRIDKKAQQTAENAGRITTKELNDRVAAYDAMYGKQSSAAQATAQRLTQYERTVAAEHTARMRQQAAEDREYATIQSGVERATDRVGTRALATARAFEVMGRTGKETGRSLDTIMSQVGYLAFGFGAQGALVGAIAIGTAAIIEMFTRTSKELDKLHEKYDKETESLMRHGSLLAVDARRQELFSGGFAIRGKDDTDASFIGRSQGILGLAAEAARINQAVEAIRNIKGLHTESDAKDIADLHDKLRAVNAELGVLGTQWTQLGQRESKEMEIAKARAKIDQDKKNEKFAERSVGEYENKELDRIVARIKASGDLTPMLTNERNEVVALRNEQSLLRYELDRVNMSVKDRIEKEKELARVTKELQQTEGTNIFMNGMNVKVNPKVSEKASHDEYDKEQIAAIKKAGEKMKEEANRIANDIGRTLAHGITDGIKTWFSGGGFAGGFKAMTAAILDGLGQMFAEVAEKALIGSTIMKKVIEAIQSMNPWVAAVAAGALLAFGNSIRNSGGSGSGGGGSGYGGGGLPPIVNTGVVTAAATPNSIVTSPASIQSRSMQTNNYYVIGEDPKAWRQVQERLDQNARRG